MQAKHGFRSRARLIGLALVAAFALSAVLAGSASATPAPITSQQLSLGDSLAFGYSEQLLNENLLAGDPATAFEHGYVNYYFNAHKPKANGIGLVNVGCPGETTDSLIGNGALAAALGIAGESPCAYHKGGLPLHNEYGVGYKGQPLSQLEASISVLAHGFLEGKPVTNVTLNIGANDELHQIAACEAGARAAAIAYAKHAAEVVGFEAAHTPAALAEEKAAGEAAGGAAYVKALEEGKTPEEAAAIAAAAGKAAGEAKGYEIAVAAATAWGAAHGKETAEKYGAEHGVAEVKACIEAHVAALFGHILENQGKIGYVIRNWGKFAAAAAASSGIPAVEALAPTLAPQTYTGKIVLVGSYDPYGNVFGTGELLAGSNALNGLLNGYEASKVAPGIGACFANPAPKFNTGNKFEPAKLQTLTNMANTTESNGRKNGPDIHPTPAGYKVMSNVIIQSCGL